MQCYNVRKYLEKLAVGEINGIFEQQLHDHLQSCPGCREEYAEMKQALEMWQRTPKIELAPQFGPVWRQRARQEAFKNEANRRSFFSVFKANTIIPALGVSAVFMVFGVFSIYNHFAPKVTIEPLINKYNPALSSSVGIPLTAKFLSGKTPKDITYHWITEYGQFLIRDGSKVTELGADAVTCKNKVYWSINFKDKRECLSFRIHLQVKDLKLGKIIAQAELGIERDRKKFFVVKKSTKR